MLELATTMFTIFVSLVRLEATRKPYSARHNLAIHTAIVDRENVGVAIHWEANTQPRTLAARQVRAKPSNSTAG